MLKPAAAGGIYCAKTARARAAALGLDYPGIHGAPGLDDTGQYGVHDYLPGSYRHDNRRYQPGIEAGQYNPDGDAKHLGPPAYGHLPHHHHHPPLPRTTKSEYTPPASALIYDPVWTHGGDGEQFEYVTPDPQGSSTDDLEENGVKGQDRARSGAFSAEGRDRSTGASDPASRDPYVGGYPRRRGISPRAYRNQRRKGSSRLTPRGGASSVIGRHPSEGRAKGVQALTKPVSQFLLGDHNRQLVRHKAALRRQRKPFYPP
ncbi:unnamed protein product [Merluccius merluccius]